MLTLTIVVFALVLALLFAMGVYFTFMPGDVITMPRDQLRNFSPGERVVINDVPHRVLRVSVATGRMIVRRI